MNDLKKLTSLLIIIIVFCCLLPLLFYIYMFAGNGFSRNSGNWANFSTYLSLFISVGNLVVFAILTYAIHKYNLRKDIDTQRQIELQNKPVLAFTKQTKEQFYSLVNVGKSSALNVIVHSHLENNKWQQAYLLYSINTGSVYSLKWTTDCNALYAEYYDNFGNRYISFMTKDFLSTIDCSDPESIERNKKEYDLVNNPSAEPTWMT